MQTRSDSTPSFYGGDACGTFFAVGGTFYGPGNIPAGPSADGLIPVSQTTTGAGTPANPYVIKTTVGINGTALRVLQSDTWALGANHFTTSVTVINDSASMAYWVRVYRAADCYLNHSDYGFGTVGPGDGTEAGSVACQSATNPTTPGMRLMGWVPQTPGSTFMESTYYNVWDAVQSGFALPSTCDCETYEDNGMAISWAGNLDPDTSKTFTSNLVFAYRCPHTGRTHAGPAANKGNVSHAGSSAAVADPTPDPHQPRQAGKGIRTPQASPPPVMSAIK